MTPSQKTTLEPCPIDPSASTDLAFIDVGKTGYLAYYERCLDLLRPGGLVMIDNTLWDGAEADPEHQDTATQAIRAFNRHVQQDQRVALSLVPVGDGLTLAQKRSGP